MNDAIYWEQCDNPRYMIKVRGFSFRLFSPRKVRLLACGLCRLLGAHAEAELNRAVIEVCERFADGHATEDELRAAHESATSIPARVAAASTPPNDGGPNSNAYAAWAYAIAARSELSSGDFWHHEGLDSGIIHCVRTALKLSRDHMPALANMVREVLGNPFRPVTIDPRWLTASVLDLARAIYDERAFERMPILADALMDAGCDNEEILNHCRGDGPHVRGCWVVDLLLGKK
jgi:hypothetical protein